jgi:hypothetical protein
MKYYYSCTLSSLSLSFETVIQWDEKRVNYCAVLSFFYGATTPSESGLLIIKPLRLHRVRHTALGRTPLDEWSARLTDLYLTTQHSPERDIRATGGIRTRHPSKTAAADPRLSLRGHWDWFVLWLGMYFLLIYITVHTDNVLDRYRFNQYQSALQLYAICMTHT